MLRLPLWEAYFTGLRRSTANSKAHFRLALAKEAYMPLKRHLRKSSFASGTGECFRRRGKATVLIDWIDQTKTPIEWMQNKRCRRTDFVGHLVSNERKTSNSHSETLGESRAFRGANWGGQRTDRGQASDYCDQSSYRDEARHSAVRRIRLMKMNWGRWPVFRVLNQTKLRWNSGQVGRSRFASGHHLWTRINLNINVYLPPLWPRPEMNV